MDSLNRARIKERLASISPRRQEMIRPALENPRDFVLLSIQRMAGELKSDPATLLRTVRELGFSGYKQFQLYLYELSHVYSSSLERHKGGAATAAERNRTWLEEARLRTFQNL